MCVVGGGGGGGGYLEDGRQEGAEVGLCLLFQEQQADAQQLGRIHCMLLLPAADLSSKGAQQMHGMALHQQPRPQGRSG